MLDFTAAGVLGRLIAFLAIFHVLQLARRLFIKAGRVILHLANRAA
jgi:hypothetical protein